MEHAPRSSERGGELREPVARACYTRTRTDTGYGVNKQQDTARISALIFT